LVLALAGYLWKTSTRDFSTLTPREEMRRIVCQVQRLVVYAIAIYWGASFFTEQDGTWHMTVIRDTDFTPLHIIEFYMSYPIYSISQSQSPCHAPLDIEATSALIVTGAYSVTSNGVFGLNINNGSSLTLTTAKLNVTQNTLCIQLGINASGFLDGKSTLLANQNLSAGITIVSRSHLVDFGGTIQTISNGIHCSSLNSKAGLDLDAGSQVTSSSNGGDGVHLEQSSELTIFNNPNFSGNPTATLRPVQSNQANGINVLTSSHVLDDNFAAIASGANIMAGMAADDGSSVTFGQTIPVPGVQTVVAQNNPDVRLAFGSRLTYIANDNFGRATCDGTALIRGPGTVTSGPFTRVHRPPLPRFVRSREFARTRVNALKLLLQPEAAPTNLGGRGSNPFGRAIKIDMLPSASDALLPRNCDWEAHGKRSSRFSTLSPLSST
jgi:hypothetical protein